MYFSLPDKFKSSVHSPSSSIFVNYWGEYLTPWLINVQLMSNYAFLRFGGEQLVYSGFCCLLGLEITQFKQWKWTKNIITAELKTKTITSKTLKCSKELMCTAVLNEMDSFHINVA